MANRYWVGNGGNWSDTSHWSTTSGGSGGASVPTQTEDVVFDANSFSSASQIIVADVNPFTPECKNFNASTVTNNPTFSIPSNFYIYGANILFSSNLIVLGSGTLYISSNGPITHSLTSNGCLIQVPITITEFSFSSNVSFILQDNFTSTKEISLAALNFPSTLTFDGNNFDITCGGISAGQAQTTIKMGSGVWTFNPVSNYIFNYGPFGGSLPIINSGTSQIIVNLTAGQNVNLWTLSGVGLFGHGPFNLLNDLVISGDGVSSATFNINSADLTLNSLILQNAPLKIVVSKKTHSFINYKVVIGTLTSNGTSGKLITFESSGSGSSVPFAIEVGSTSVSYSSISWSQATGASAPIDNTLGGIDGGNTSGWTFPITLIANFTSDVTTGTLPLAVTFTDTSTGSPTSWLWDFKNNGEALSTEQNPVYTYTASGTYTVTLTATNPTDTDTVTKTSYITVIASNNNSLVFKDSDGVQKLKLKSSGDTNPYSEIFDGSLQTADRTYRFPNLDGTIALLESLSAITPLSYDSATGEFSIAQAGASADGYLSQGDWNTFNNKENVLSFTSPLDRTSDVISLKDLSGFGAPGEAIKTNGTADGLEWGVIGGGDFMSNGTVSMTAGINFEPYAGQLAVNPQTQAGQDGGSLYLFPGLGNDIGGTINAIQTVSVNTGGTGYTYADILTLSAGGGDATVTVEEIDGGIIDSVSMHIGDEGAGYTVNDQLTEATDGNGDAVFNVDSVDGLGSITGISIVTAGTGYQSSNDRPVTGGTGTGARVNFLTLVTAGGVTRVTLTTLGTGYSVGTSAVTGGTGNDDCIINIDAIYAPTPNGKIIIADPESFWSTAFDTASLTADRILTFPDATGTFALESTVTQSFVVGADTLNFTNGILTSVT